MTNIHCSNLCFKYESQNEWLFHDLSFTLERGEILVINGSSGSGKTTLLYILSKIIPEIKTGKKEGEILIKDKNINDYETPEIAKEMSLLWQDPDKQLIFPTVELELAFYPANFNLPANIIKNRINKILDHLEIENLRKRDTAFLSFGEKKLVALASLLSYNPNILLMDELSAGLSEKKLKLVMNKIIDLKNQGKILMIADNNAYIKKISTKIINIDEYK